MNKHIKAYEQFVNESTVNEAMKAPLNPRTSMSGSILQFPDLEAAGVEIPNFRMNLGSLRKKRSEINNALIKLKQINDTLKHSPELESHYEKQQKELRKETTDKVKSYNDESKKLYTEFIKVLKSAKFPTDAKYKVESEEEKEGEKLTMEFDDTGFSIFNAWINISYEYLLTGKRKPSTCSNYFHWNEVVFQMYSPIKAPDVMDKEFLLDYILSKDL
jgi:hypothetical protein